MLQHQEDVVLVGFMIDKQRHADTHGAVMFDGGLRVSLAADVQRVGFRQSDADFFRNRPGL
jgi:hypothetical protein